LPNPGPIGVTCGAIDIPVRRPGREDEWNVSIIPTMRNREAAKMIGWLCDAFGFERRLII
jgi:hypothetical protein